MLCNLQLLEMHLYLCGIRIVWNPVPKKINRSRICFDQRSTAITLAARLSTIAGVVHVDSLNVPLAERATLKAKFGGSRRFKSLGISNLLNLLC